MNHSISLDVGKLTEDALVEVGKKIKLLLAVDRLEGARNQDFLKVQLAFYGIPLDALEHVTREIKVSGCWPSLFYDVTDSIPSEYLPSEKRSGKCDIHIWYEHSNISSI